MKTVAILQARMGSTRLPGKVLADVHGRPMLQWLLDRVKAVPDIDEIVVATTRDPGDDRLAAWLSGVPGVACFRGDADDVLDRYFQASRGRGADVVVRLTGDDPLKDPGLVSRTIQALREHPEVDYVSTFIKPTFPEGLDVEAMRIEALERAHAEARLPSEREHVTPYLWKNPDLFKLLSIEQDRDQSAWRWTVDKPADLDFVRAVYAHFLDRPLVPYQELVAFIEAHPELPAINAGTLRQEGYLKSLQKDRT
jgi:spore coat polysaccharide biosynthesis protein SpsF